MRTLDLPIEDSPYVLDEHGPLFVLGCPRSGTTFLTQCLAKLSGVETFVGVLAPPRLMHLIGWNFTQGKNSDDLLECVRDVFWQAFWRRRLFRSERLAQLYLRNTSVSEFLSRGTLEDTVFCYKEPFLCFAVEQIARAFPRSKFVHIVRDGRDNADSMERSYPHALSEDTLRTRELIENKNAEVGSFRAHDSFFLPWWVREGEESRFLSVSKRGRYLWMWREMTQRAVKLRDLVGDDRYCEIKYENFVQAPLEEGPRLATFVGKPMNGRMRRALSRAFTSSVGIGSKQASKNRLDEDEEIAGKLLAELRYE